MKKMIEGFSDLTKAEKIEWLVKNNFTDNEKAKTILEQYWNSDPALQKLHDEFTENTISNYYIPFSVVPNFLINDTMYTVPMVIEESSVVAGAGKAAKFWATRGGFSAKVISAKKTGQIHFTYDGDGERLRTFFHFLKPKLLQAIAPMIKNMEKRGGGVIDIMLRDRTFELKDYYHLHCIFDTSDAMGGNFINSCLEKFTEVIKHEVMESSDFTPKEKKMNIIMSILSNYIPDCLVRAEVSCKVDDLAGGDITAPKEFSDRFIRAIDIAKAESYRAVTHNKGVMNGIDAVVLATGNDFRAVEAGAHSYALRRGRYSSLTHAMVKDGLFTFWIEIPLAVGTVGGLTTLHPMVKLAHEMLGNPKAKELMKIIAAVGLAQNFAAIASLITTGIQKGHMKMHLSNILNQMNASEAEKEYCIAFFQDKTITYDRVVNQLNKMRKR